MALTKERLNAILKSTPWIPQKGPQLAAFNSKADIIFYGGAAGGGKTDLAAGLALTKHRRTLFVRREAVQLRPVVDRLTELLGNRNGYNGTTSVWNLPGQRQVVFGGVPTPGDESKFQGASRDLLVIDECTNLLEEQVQFLMGWVRSSIKGQACRTLLCSNPPTSAEGEWVIRWFAPWLDPNYAGTRAANGELRWFASIDGKDTEVESGKRFTHNKERIVPRSRTFIQSMVTDNRFLAESGYVATLQALPEPLRSQMLNGDFMAGRTDDEWQLIPSADVDAAMARWKERDMPGPITSIGCDPARGGADNTVLSVRHGWWFDRLAVYENTPTGGDVAAKLVETLKYDTGVPVHLDVIGIGSSVLDHLQSFNMNVVPINGAAKATEFATDVTGTLPFCNLRAETWWRLKELLSNETSVELALPPDARLKADLCAPRYMVNARGILIESKQDIYKRLGRSPDYGDAVAYAATRTLSSANVTPIKVNGRISGGSLLR